MRILIDHDDFSALVRGRIVTHGSVEIALSDIGQLAMANEALQAHLERTGDKRTNESMADYLERKAVEEN